MPNHYYGYDPAGDEPDISFSSVRGNRDNVYSPPLNDMPTNPSNPLYQAMDNQRGPTYQQEQQQQEEREPDVSFANELEGGFSDTALGQAMNNANNAQAMTVNADESQSLEDYLEATNQDATLSGERGNMNNQDIDGFDYVDPGMGTSEPVTATFDSVDPGGRTVPGAEGSAFSMRDGVVINPYEGSGGARSEIETEGGRTDGGGDAGPDKGPTGGQGSESGGQVSGGRGFTDEDASRPDAGGDDGVDSTNPLLRSSYGVRPTLESVLSEYNVAALQGEFGNVFETYDPTREEFAQQRADLQLEGLDLQRDAAGIGLERQQGQFGRQAGLLESQLESNIAADALAQRRLGLQRTALEARQGDVDEDLALRNQLLNLQQEQQYSAADAARRGARANLMGLYDQSQVTGGFAGSGARDMVRQRAIQGLTDSAQSRISSLTDTRRIGLAKQQAQQQRDRQQRSLGSQLSGLDISNEARQLQFESQQGRISSQLEGIQAELGNEGFLQRAFENRMAGLDISGRQIGLSTGEKIFGIREDYEEDTRRRLIDIIRGGGNLNRFKLATDDGPNQTDQDIGNDNGMGFYNDPVYRQG